MTTKLTLSIEEKTIELAKLYAARSGKSLSKIVEAYLNAITEQADKKPSAVMQLSGILNEKHTENTDWKQIKAKYLNEKYGS